MDVENLSSDLDLLIDLFIKLSFFNPNNNFHLHNLSLKYTHSWFILLLHSSMLTLEAEGLAATHDDDVRDDMKCLRAHGITEVRDHSNVSLLLLCCITSVHLAVSAALHLHRPHARSRSDRSRDRVPHVQYLAVDCRFNTKASGNPSDGTLLSEYWNGEDAHGPFSSEVQVLSWLKK